MDENKKAEVDRKRKQKFQEDDDKKREQYNPNNLDNGPLFHGLY